MNLFFLTKSRFTGDATNTVKAYQELFYNPESAYEEIIFLKGYSQVGNNISHDLDGWNGPNQTSEGFPHRGRTNPILELVYLYEDYDHPGEISPIINTTDGNISSTTGYDPSVSYRHFDDPAAIFASRDARFFASVIYPNATWKGQQIVIQGGVVRPDGSLIDSRDSYTHQAVTYYTYGKQQPNQYSGFDGSADMTRTGFLMRKFLNEGNRCERTVELAFENKDYWDLIRRRTFHTVFKNKVKQEIAAS